MDGGNDGQFTLVYDGTKKPGVLSYLAENLEKGTPYRFKVVALNFNGQSAESNEAILYSCLPPTNIKPP